MKKQALQKLIDEIQTDAGIPVAILTSNGSYVKLFKEWFPNIKIYLTTETYLPDLNTCYVIPVEPDPIKIFTPVDDYFEESVCNI